MNLNWRSFMKPFVNRLAAFIGYCRPFFRLDDPGFPVGTRVVDEHHAAFLWKTAHMVGCQ